MKIEGINHIAIIGRGRIGTSLAVLFTGNKYKTTIYAKDDSKQQQCIDLYDEFFKEFIDKGLVSEKQFKACKALLNFTDNYEDLADADFVFECVPEKIEIKSEVYENVEKYITNPRAIISTSSAMSPEDLVVGMSKFADRIIVAHPFYPPHLIPFVEMLGSSKTAEGVAEGASEFLESTGRKTVIMKKNAPGFIANRLQHAVFREAMNIVQRGIASPRDVDKAAMYSFMPRYTKIGIFEHVDNSGVDMNYDIESYLYKDLCNTGGVMPMIKELYDKGDYGVKTGKGVYDWSNVDMEDFKRRVSEPYWEFFDWDLPEE